MSDRLIELAGMLLGLLYLYYEYKADSKLWIVSIIMPMISIWVYLNAGLYADFAIAIYYFLAAIYGYWMWTKSSAAHKLSGTRTIDVQEKEAGGTACNRQNKPRQNGAEIGGKIDYKKDVEKPSLPITHIPLMTLVYAIFVTLILWAAIYYILVAFTNSNVPLCDSFTTAMSIMGMYLLARKYVEQWIVWVIVDIVSTGLYFYKGIYFYSCLNSVYTVVACMGYLKWRRMIVK